MGKSGVRALWPYLIGPSRSGSRCSCPGVHATIAGVLAAATVPVVTTPGAPDSGESPLHRLEHKLAPLVAFAIVPLFGFANAGVSLGGIGIEELLSPLPLGIAAGLFLASRSASSARSGCPSASASRPGCAERRGSRSTAYRCFAGSASR
jgi:NhaA family Na+:H+ antiporter